MTIAMTATMKRRQHQCQGTSDAFNFSYRLTLNLNTSFTGKDHLYTRTHGHYEERLDRN